MPNIRLYESMLFNNETTNKTDFQYGDIVAEKRTVYQHKPRWSKPHSPHVIDNHTLTECKKANIPTELYVKPKEIVRTDPRKTELQSLVPVQKVEISDEDRQAVGATRPRLVMTPAVSMDDIGNPDVRGLLINDIYTSSIEKMQEEMRNSWRDLSYRAPMNGHLTPANPITIQKLEVPYVSPEWRMDSVSWDNRQLRSSGDPCKEFYLARVPRCSACAFTAARESQEKAMKKH